MSEATSVAVIGGTGSLGSGIAYRLAKAGLTVWLASRDAAKAGQAKDAMQARTPSANLSSGDYATAAAAADLVIVAVPFAAQKDALLTIKDKVKGKIVIDTTVCLKPPKVGTVQLPPEGSAGMIAQGILGGDAKVVSAFQNIAAAHLDSDHHVECDVLVCGDDNESVQAVIALSKKMGLEAYAAGPLANSAAVEGLTSILITLNRKYKSPGAGIRITNIPGAPGAH